MQTLTTQDIIDNLVMSIYGQPGNARQKHMLEQSLHSLVRLAKAEQILEIKASVKKLTGAIDLHPGKRPAKVTPRN